MFLDEPDSGLNGFRRCYLATGKVTAARFHYAFPSIHNQTHLLVYNVLIY